MFAPEILLHTYDAFLRQTKNSKVLVANMIIARYHVRLQLQCYDGNVVWTWSTGGINNLSEFFGVDIPEFRPMERGEDYDQYDYAKTDFEREYLKPHFEAQFLDAGYEEGYFTNLVIVAQEPMEN